MLNNGTVTILKIAASGAIGAVLPGIGIIFESVPGGLYGPTGVKGYNLPKEW